jgi:hypothetical protein
MKTIMRHELIHFERTQTLYERKVREMLKEKFGYQSNHQAE